jgi:3-phosphoshikimate 1-carboxyvinyltransferase
MQAVVRAGKVNGTIQAPSSKSMMQRACAAALLHHGRTIIHHPGTSADDKAALSVIQQLGATIASESDNKIVIESNGVAPISTYIDCGESGLSTRLFTPIAALAPEPIEIRGKGSLLKRPMNVFQEALPLLGVSLPDFKGRVPFTVNGPLTAAPVTVDGSISSQFLTGLLFALTAAVKERTTIHVNGLKSKPYIDLTLAILQQFGTPVAHDNYQQFHIDPALFTKKDIIEINIEGDWSSAAFMLAAGAIAGTVTVTNLDSQSMQADKALISVLKSCGTQLIVEDDSITTNISLLKPFDFDATHCPDLFPILSILAACCRGESNITGLHRLFHKESNRAESIAEMLQQFAVSFSLEDDTLCINGTGHLDTATIDSYGDHRIAMAAAIGALRARGAVVIDGAESISKSYPSFFDDLSSLGINCTLNND